jgi:hypothetical protein
VKLISDLDRGGAIMIRQIVIALVAIAALLTFAPKVSHGFAASEITTCCALQLDAFTKVD